MVAREVKEEREAKATMDMKNVNGCVARITTDTAMIPNTVVHHRTMCLNTSHHTHHTDLNVTKSATKEVVAREAKVVKVVKDPREATAGAATTTTR